MTKKQVYEELEKVGMEVNNMINFDLIKGAIYGGAIGDALGIPVECRTRTDVRNTSFKKIEKELSFFSDDTSLTLASMDALVKSGFKRETFMNNFVDWLYYGAYTTLGYAYGYGKGTKSAIDKFIKTNNVSNCGNDSFENNGNGALMRITPVCLALLTKEYDIDTMITILSDITKLTHANEISILGNVIYFIFFKTLIETKNKYIAYDVMRNFDYSKWFDEKTIKNYDKILNGNCNIEPSDTKNFFVINTLECVIFCVMNNNNFKNSIECAIKLGYDTDTVAAITGNITGALYGYKSIPKSWLKNLEGKKLLDTNIKRFNYKFVKEHD